MIGDGYHDLPPGRLATIVTHLERATPADPAAPVFPAGLTPVVVIAPDPERYRALFRRVGEDWLWVSRLAMAEADLAAVLAAPDVEIWTLRRGAEDLALLELDFRDRGSCEIAFLGLAAELTGQRLGRQLMALAFARAQARGAGRIWLHTCTIDHPAALPLYRASGFAPFRREVEVTADPRLTGLIRADAAPHVPTIPPR